MASLEVRDVTVRFGGNVALDAGQHPRRARLHHRADRPERRGQDHPLQRHHRAASAQLGSGAARRQGRDAGSARPSGPAAAWPEPSSAWSCSACSPCARTFGLPRTSGAGWSKDKDDPVAAVEAIIDRVGLRAIADERVDGAAHRAVPPRGARPLPGDEADGAAARRTGVGPGRDRDHAVRDPAAGARGRRASRWCSSSTTFSSSWRSARPSTSSTSV